MRKITIYFGLSTLLFWSCAPTRFVKPLVYDNKPGTKEAVKVEGGEHETTPYVMGYQNYIDKIAEFIEN